MSGLRKELEVSYDFAIRSTYDEIYNIDLLTGNYLLVHCIVNSVVKPKESGVYEELADFILNELMLPEDRFKYKDVITFDNIKELKESDIPLNVEHRRKAMDGKYYWFDVSFKKVKDKDIVMCFVKNIDLKKRKEEELNGKERRYDMILRSNYNFICDVNVATGRYHIALADLANLLIPKEGDFNEQTLYAANTIVHPEDREWYINNMMLENLKKYFLLEDDFNYEFRCVDKDNNLTYHEFIGKYFKGNEPSEDSIILVGKDITIHKEMEKLFVKYQLLEQQYTFQEQMIENVSRFNTLIEDTNTILFEWAIDGHLLFVTPNWDLKFGSGTAIGLELEKELLDERRVHPDDYDKFMNVVTNVDNGMDQQECLIRLKNNKGDYIWCRLLLKRIYDTDRKPIKISGIITDVNDIINFPVNTSEQ